MHRGDRATLVTRHLPQELAVHVPAGVDVKTLKIAHSPTRFHFLESICDVLYSPLLFLLVPTDTDWDIYWNDNTLAALFVDSLRRRKRRLFFCLQLPHFAYGQTMLVARSYPPLSWLVPVFAPLYRWLDRLMARRADLIVAISQMVRRDCLRVYGTVAPITGSPGIDPPRPEVIDRDFIRRDLGIRSPYILVTAGKLIPKKNFDLFVRVIDRLRRDGVDVTGVIIGDGPFRERVARLIRSLDLASHCLMTGFVAAYDDVLRYMSGATIYVYLERNVPFGLTPLEASSLAVPVVAFEGGGVDETVVDGETGRTIPTHYDAEDIARLLADMLQHDRGMLRRWGERGAQVAVGWTWEQSYTRFVGLMTGGA